MHLDECLQRRERSWDGYVRYIKVLISHFISRETDMMIAAMFRTILFDITSIGPSHYNVVMLLMGCMFYLNHYVCAGIFSACTTKRG
jgi:hypothetical protein